jgi:hypothetical protein
MKQYIDKAAVVAEIERRIDEVNQIDKASYEVGLFDAYKIILSFLDTLEVKEIGVDLGDPKGDKSAKYIIDTKTLEKEIQQHINDCLDIKFPTTDIKMISKDVEYTARKFFELGLKTQKGE